jgi:hypothetical protein
MPGGYVGGRPKDESKLSRDPKQMRNRLRRGKGEALAADIQMYADEVWGGRNVQDWDIEELAFGRPRDANGQFRGMAPRWITPIVEREIKLRLHTLTRAKLSAHMDIAVKAIAKLIESDEVDEKGRPIVDARTKFAASAFVIEHIIGKPNQHIDVDAGEATKSAIASAIVLDDGLPQGHLTDVVEAEIVEDDMEVIDDDNG